MHFVQHLSKPVSVLAFFISKIFFCLSVAALLNYYGKKGKQNDALCFMLFASWHQLCLVF